MDDAHTFSNSTFGHKVTEPSGRVCHHTQIDGIEDECFVFALIGDEVIMFMFWVALVLLQQSTE